MVWIIDGLFRFIVPVLASDGLIYCVGGFEIPSEVVSIHTQKEPRVKDAVFLHTVLYFCIRIVRFRVFAYIHVLITSS